jgi:hypothetical protein
MLTHPNRARTSVAVRTVPSFNNLLKNSDTEDFGPKSAEICTNGTERSCPFGNPSGGRLRQDDPFRVDGIENPPFEVDHMMEIGAARLTTSFEKRFDFAYHNNLAFILNW